MIRRNSSKVILALPSLLIFSIILVIISVFSQYWLSETGSTNNFLISANRIVTGALIGMFFGTFLFWVTARWSEFNDKNFPGTSKIQGQIDELQNKFSEKQAFSIFSPGGALDMAFRESREIEEFLSNEATRYEAIGLRYLILAIASSFAGIWFVLTLLSSPVTFENQSITSTVSGLAVVGILQMIAIFLLRSAASSDKMRHRLVESIAQTKRQRIAIGLSAEDFIEGKSFALSIPTIVGVNSQLVSGQEPIGESLYSGSQDSLMFQRVKFWAENLK